MSITMKKAIEKFQCDVSDYVKNQLIRLDTIGYLQRYKYPYRLNLHQKENICKNLPLKDGRPCLRAYVYSHFMFLTKDTRNNIYISSQCTSNNKALEHPSYKSIYQKQYNILMKNCANIANETVEDKFYDDNTIVDGGDSRKGIKIDDNNVKEIIDSIMNTMPALSPEYIKMFLNI